MSFYAFTQEDAFQYGINEAIIINFLRSQISSGVFIAHKGKSWMDLSLYDLRFHHPFWGIEKIRTIMKSLERQKVIDKKRSRKLGRYTLYSFTNGKDFL